jgi:RNase adapter protein RapZ
MSEHEGSTESERSADDTGEIPAVGELGELVIVTGMTGAGRSTAAKELEDLGYFVVDNLPPELVTEVVRLVDEKMGRAQPIAVVVDVRGGTRFHLLREQIALHLPTRRASVLFLEADDDILVRRQEAARRPHPLQEGGRLLDGIHREREVMTQLRGDAEVVIDTTPLNVHQLKDKVAAAYGTPERVGLKVTVVSFGFKYGVPVDADLLADMRFLPNPFWVPELKELTGKDPSVASFVKDRDDAQSFLERYLPVIETVGAGYLREGKRFMTVAIGCTGGKHRSVAMSEEIASRLRAAGVEAEATHRDLGRE